MPQIDLNEVRNRGDDYDVRLRINDANGTISGIKVTNNRSGPILVYVLNTETAFPRTEANVNPGTVEAVVNTPNGIGTVTFESAPDGDFWLLDPGFVLGVEYAS